MQFPLKIPVSIEYAAGLFRAESRTSAARMSLWRSGYDQLPRAAETTPGIIGRELFALHCMPMLGFEPIRL
jgi:hypothetical protein